MADSVLPYQIVRPEEIPKLAARISSWPAAVVDVETNGVEPYLGTKLLDVGIGAMGDQEEYFVLNNVHDLPTEAYKPVLEALATKPVVNQNIKFDFHMLAEALGFEPQQPQMFDLLPMARIHSMEERPVLDLETQANRHLGMGYDSVREAMELIGKGKAEKVPPEKRAEYNVRDLGYTKRLYYFYKKNLSAAKLRLAGREAYISRDLWDIERRGQLIDQDYLDVVEKKILDKMEQLLEPIRRETGNKDFNPQSPQQVAKLMEAAGIAPVKKTGKGGPSWDKEAMKEVRHLHPVAMAVAQHRSLAHTYQGIVARCRASVKHGQDSLHGTFSNGGTVTGRLSSSDPNRQNDPHGWLQIGEEGDDEEPLAWTKGPQKEISIERLFLAHPGYVLFNVDYRQIEMFWLGFYMNDPVFDAWLATGNVHAAVAADVWGDAEAYYDRGKRMNFALIYGQGNKALAKVLGSSEADTTKFRQQYFDRMPGYNRLMSQVRYRLIHDGSISNYYGREYHLDADRAYVGVNYLCQGSAGDFVKQKLPLTRKRRQDLGIHVLKTTHDDFTFEVPLESINEFSATYLPLLETCPFGRLGIDVEWSTTSMVDMKDWSEVPDYAQV